ncbi:hypothetical protein DO021_18890 [Desulfobacter hydrogenophilus]|uniref:Uncharacterized protein n=1 Tax=Desulfobacter hydrogenophilus TaxID=2291 RepID=A0A328FAK7_9BACT|nr:hypothetical protein [Desulfobacter hydrogenophilus]NDY73835.1 hypothetical protein [Desulfobacter hydrogenophilus]QBH13154.1 hypothetical protein EYB58_09625 [Desulfobacter hydrogenophilus]RAM00452.1 hypothetical protein DO021_18890 [Desulfobacter hydrogenophilus]
MKKNQIYLDVGNKIQTGILDHHQVQTGPKQYKCAAQIVVDQPNLILGAVEINPYKKSLPVNIVLHRNPDFDCCASAYLASELIKNGELPEGAELLADYTAQVDAGFKMLDPGQMKTPFVALLSLSNYISRIRPKTGDHNSSVLGEGMNIMKILTQSLVRGTDPDSSQSLDWTQEPLSTLFSLVRKDYAQYRKNFQRTSATAFEVLSLPLFKRGMSGIGMADALFIKDYNSMLFKYWARSDKEHSPGGNGFIMTLATKNDITIIATDPNTEYFLPYLGQVLEKEEVYTRLEKEGKDSRIYGPQGNMKKIRFHYNNDPWYDGRGHDFTIIQNPSCGTVLSHERIVAITKDLYCDPRLNHACS